MRTDGYGRATDADEVLSAFTKQRIANAGCNGILNSHRLQMQTQVPKDMTPDVDYFLRDVWVMLATGKLVLTKPGE